MHDTTLGLRDRKRIQTRARLEDAAVRLVLEVGLQHATVELICQAADVSPRTFFNYFDSKEDAILGLSDLELTDDVVLVHAEASANGDIVDALTGLILELAGPNFENTSLHPSRIEILRRYPALFGRQVARLTEITDDLHDAVLTLMERDPRFSNLAGAASPLAESILALCASTVRTAAKEWIAAGGDAPIDEMKIRAVALAREVVERLQ